jgi:rare lipoprotein A
MWEGISRPAYERRENYADIEEGERGYVEINYARSRKILEVETMFYPDEPLLMKHALLWLFRTRNIRELPDMQPETLSSMVSDYPIVEEDRNLTGRTNKQELLTMMRKLDQMLVKEVHEVSFYADYFHGRGTAFGETFDMNDITAAHRSFPHNTLVKVTNVDNDKSIIVRINDRGPYVHGRDMDLSKASFLEIAPQGQGVLRATFERLGNVEMVNSCEQRQQVFQKRITRDIRFFRGVPHDFTIRNPLVLQSTKPFVVQSIVFPDGQNLRIQDFVNPKEKYQFSPDMTGLYTFFIGDTLGHIREMRMNVSSCVLPI